MTKLAPEWVRTSDPVIRSPARYRWTTAPARVTARHVYESAVLRVIQRFETSQNTVIICLFSR